MSANDPAEVMFFFPELRSWVENMSVVLWMAVGGVMCLKVKHEKKGRCPGRGCCDDAGTGKKQEDESEDKEETDFLFFTDHFLSWGRIHKISHTI